jgi:ABC-type uncharacterized transport system substrate-binding protein
MSASSACVFVPLEQPPGPIVEPAASTAEPPASPPALPAPPEKAPIPAPHRATRARPSEPPPPPRVVVLLPRDDTAFDPTLPALEAELSMRGFDVTAVESHAALYVLPAPKAGQKTFAIAVGGEAEAVAEQLHMPIVFCHVAPLDPGIENENVHGVPALPPLALQLQAWKQLSPGLSRVALILGPGRENTIAEARQAAEAQGISLVYRTASSDQEALYLFKRLAPEVDGLWLLPDNRVLSPRVIKAMLAQASRHRVQSLAFTPTLLEWGALLSVSSTPRNLAWTLAEVMSRLVSSPAEVPSLTPLSEVEIEINETAASRLGIRPPAAKWTVRSEAL